MNTETARTATNVAHDMALNDLLAAPSPAALARRVVDADDCDDCLVCEWRLADICETFGVTEDLAERAIGRYGRALRDAAAIWADDAAADLSPDERARVIGAAAGYADLGDAMERENAERDR